MREFGLEVTRDADAVVMWIRGEVDLHHRELLAETAIGHLRDGCNVIADLFEVTFLDSSGLSAFVRAWREAERCGVDFRVRRATNSVAVLLEVTGLHRLLVGDEA